MTEPITLNQLLKTAGVSVAATEPTKTAATAAKPVSKTAGDAAAHGPNGKPTPVKAKDDASQPNAVVDGGHKPRATKDEAEKQDTGKTAEQIWLSQHGVDVKDVKVAEMLFAQQVKIAEQEKFAELEKFATEERCRGVLQYHGQMIEQAAIGLATGQGDYKTAEYVSAITRVPLTTITKRAEEIAGALPHAALVGGDLGRAARVNDSRTLQAAEENGATTIFRPDGEAGTRAPVTGQDEKTLRFVDKYVLPGNPGLNNGQAVDQGKGLGQ
jgi:hypothetical protein